MALTPSQIRIGFRMLNIPYASPLALVDQISLNTTTFKSSATANSPQTLLRAWFAGSVVTFPDGSTGQMDADSITRAGIIIDKWDTLSAGRGISGTISVGSIQGINLNVNELCDNCVGDLQSLVPFFKDLKDMVSGAPATARPVNCNVF